MQRLLTCLPILCVLLTGLIISCDEDSGDPVGIETMTDFVPYFIDEDSTKTPCLDSLYELESVTEAHIYYNSGLEVVVNDNDLCVTITNDVDGDVPDTVVVGHCDGMLCDTTIIVVFSCTRCNTPQHECTPYAESVLPTPMGNEWMSVYDYKYFGIPSPTKPGGGIVSVTVSAPSDGIPTVGIDNVFDQDGSIAGGTASGTSTPNVFRAKYVCHPGVSFQLRAATTTGSVFPMAFSVNFVVEERADCYEPNDDIFQAKMVPIGESLEAYGLPGHQDWYIAEGSSQTYDWYRFQVDSMARIRVQLTNSPSDVRLDMGLYSPSQISMVTNSIPVSGNLGDEGRTYNIETGSPVMPGIYYLRIQTVGFTGKIQHDAPEPDHWGTKYKFKVGLF